MPECAHCKTPFEKKKANQKFCSALCYQRNWAATHRYQYNARMRAYHKKRREAGRSELICPGCQKVFQQTHKTQRYCTPQCHQAHYARERREQHNDYRYRYIEKALLKTPWMLALTAAKARAKKYNRAFELTNEWCKANWNGYCALSGLPFEIVVRQKDRNPFSPSIDRVDSNGGYTQTNCRFVLTAINVFKADWSDETIIKIARGIVECSFTSGRKDL